MKINPIQHIFTKIHARDAGFAQVLKKTRKILFKELPTFMFKNLITSITTSKKNMNTMNQSNIKGRKQYNSAVRTHLRSTTMDNTQYVAKRAG